jgi:thiamine biosynthesis lipoprotein
VRRLSLAANIFVILLSVAGIAGIFLIRGMNVVRSSTREGVAMDTVIRVTASAVLGRRELDMALDGVFDLMRDLEKKFSMQDPDSALSAVNRSAGASPVEIDGDLRSVLETALRIADLTGGAFDPTIGAVTEIWRDDDGAGRLPGSDDLAAALSLVGYGGLELTEGRAYLERAGARLDLGGIAKGYASQAAARLLRERGIGSALIDLGGNVVALGHRPDGQKWRIGVQDPFKDRGSPLCVLEVSNTSVVTAGVYERRWEMDGRSWTHIYDPSTGMPIEGELLSVTVVSDDPTEGDALSTAFMVLGPARALDLMRILPGVEAVFVSDLAENGREILATSGLRGSIELEDGGYRLSFTDVY